MEVYEDTQLMTIWDLDLNFESSSFLSDHELDCDLDYELAGVMLPPSNAYRDSNGEVFEDEVAEIDEDALVARLEQNLVDQAIASVTEAENDDFTTIGLVRSSSSLSFNADDEYPYSPDFLNYLDFALFRGMISRDLYSRLLTVGNEERGVSINDLPWSLEERKEFRRIRDSIFSWPRSDGDNDNNGDDITTGSCLNYDRFVAKRTKALLEEKYAFRKPSPQFGHFQLRHVMAPVSQNEIYYSKTQVGHCEVERFNPQTNEKTTIIGDTGECYCNCATTLAADSEMVVVAGLLGHYAIKPLNAVDGRSSNLIQGQLSSDRHGITTHISIVDKNLTSARRITFASNELMVEELDVPTGKTANRIMYEHAINCTAYCPTDPRLRIVVGDSLDSLVVDFDTGKTVQTLKGHKDYVFACAWSPDGRALATAGEDGTCRVYDSRRWDMPLQVIPSQLNGAIRSLCFDPCGKTLAIAEPIDYITVVDTRDFETNQVIDLFGKIAGVGFTPGLDHNSAQDLTIAVSDGKLGGIMQYRSSQYRDVYDDVVL